MKKTDPKDTSWNNVASWYDEMLSGNDTFQEHVILPNLLRLAGNIKGENVVDVACGQGYFTRALANQGARTSGVDASKTLIESARKKTPKDISYYQSRADRLVFFPASSVDLVTCILAIQNIENVFDVFIECGKLLKPGGRMILVLNHPAFRIPKQSAWDFDEAQKIQYRRLDSYMSESKIKIDMTPGARDQKEKEFTTSFHRPLQYYFKAGHKAGLAVTRLEEWISHRGSEKGPRQAAEDTARKEFPMFLALEFTKLK